MMKREKWTRNTSAALGQQSRILHVEYLKQPMQRFEEESKIDCSFYYFGSKR
jgi:hypothetical protein